MLQAPKSCWQRCCREDVGRDAMSLPSHASNGAVEVTWLWRNVDAESCWRWYCRGNLATARCWCRVMLAMMLPRRLGRDAMSVPSHASDGPDEATWPWRDVAADNHANVTSC
jgi:hypothetical protein